MIVLVKEISVKSLEEADSARFSYTLDRKTALGILAHADKLGLEGVRDIGVILDYLIHYMAEGQLSLKKNEPIDE